MILSYLSFQTKAGCAILTVSGQCIVHLLLKGLVEADKEIEKLGKKQEMLKQTISKLEQAMSSADYEAKVPLDVRTTNKEKLEQSQIEIDRIIAAMETLSTM